MTRIAAKIQRVRVALPGERLKEVRPGVEQRSSLAVQHVFDFLDPRFQLLPFAVQVGVLLRDETGDEWVIMQMMYVDDYVRSADPGGPRWYFARRLPLYWYATDLNKPPVGENKMRWPGTDWVEGNFHKLFPSYADYWARGGDDGRPVAEPAPFDKFLETMRRGAAAPKVKVRAD